MERCSGSCVEGGGVCIVYVVLSVEKRNVDTEHSASRKEGGCESLSVIACVVSVFICPAPFTILQCFFFCCSSAHDLKSTESSSPALTEMHREGCQIFPPLPIRCTAGEHCLGSAIRPSLPAESLLHRKSGSWRPLQKHHRPDDDTAPNRLVTLTGNLCKLLKRPIS